MDIGGVVRAQTTFSDNGSSFNRFFAQQTLVEKILNIQRRVNRERRDHSFSDRNKPFTHHLHGYRPNSPNHADAESEVFNDLELEIPLRTMELFSSY